MSDENAPGLFDASDFDETDPFDPGDFDEIDPFDPDDYGEDAIIFERFAAQMFDLVSYLAEGIDWTTADALRTTAVRVIIQTARDRPVVVELLKATVLLTEEMMSRVDVYETAHGGGVACDVARLDAGRTQSEEVEMKRRWVAGHRPDVAEAAATRAIDGLREIIRRNERSTP